MPVTNYISVNGRMLSEVTDGVILDYVPDALGSIHSVVDQTATAVKTMRYKPYGEVLSRSGSISDRMYQWVGTYGYRATFNYASSHYVRARHYSQTPGAWTTVDPLWPDENVYTYAHSRVTGSLDPSGLCPIRCKPSEECVYSSPHNCPGEPNGYWYCRPRPKDEVAPPSYELPFPYYDARENPKFFGYGNFCGHGRPGTDRSGNERKPKKPVDALDKCCKEHDDNLGKNWFHGKEGYAHCKLYICASFADCSKSPTPQTCEMARWKLVQVMRALCGGEYVIRDL